MKDFFDRLFVIFLASFILFFGVYIYIAPSEDISEKENRVLAEFPKISAEAIMSGEFSRRLGNFYKDRFPQRERLMSIKCKYELLCGKKENNGVLVCENGYLLISPEYSELDTYRENLSEIERFCEHSEFDTAVFFAPRGIDVLTDILPYGYPEERNQKVFEIAQKQSFEIMSVNESIAEAARDGAYVWFKTDHHWTSRGAYIAYKRICEHFDIEALDIDDFREEELDGSFYGTVASRFAADAPASDRIEIMRYAEDERLFVVDYDTGEVTDGIYRYEYADTNDKYSVFLGGNHGHMGVYKEGEKRETLIVIKDSFANSVIPFLASHYDLEVYDLRYFKGKLREELSDISADKILLLYGIDTVVSDDFFKYLKR